MNLVTAYARWNWFKPMPLSELEKTLVVTACGSNTSWHFMHYRGERYAPHLSNYSAAAGGRTFPSGGGFHTSVTFFTDDEGVYYLDARDAPAFEERHDDGSLDHELLLDAVKSRIRILQDRRLDVPARVPYVEAHNTWVANHPGTLLVIPVGDLAQHFLLILCYMLQNGFIITDDINGRPVPGIGRFRSIVDTNNVLPLSFMEQASVGEMAAELSTSCYAGALILQAMGLGGWMYEGIDPLTVLGAAAEEGIRGLGFRFDVDERWSLPNPTGLPGVMEGFCLPHYRDMRAAVEGVCYRKFGPGGPFNPNTPGPWKDSAKVRGAAQVHSEQLRECVALQAQYIFDTLGKFPATIPSICVLMYLQAHHLDLEFYDTYYKPGAYLRTHAVHLKNWH